ncbi:hypothetical protein [Catelliglobosispora koreensis]|uniref:hypothetical protein n=1 Tax=Catelliglobosispora koreensis TaxID=129052 RepID=UPI00037F721C|nr:hypothetical protein [Catelliglobosispora koreensis]
MDTVADIVQHACAEQEVSEELLQVARTNPQALEPFHRQLFDAELHWPWLLYDHASEEFAAYVAQQAQDDPRLLSLLAATQTLTAVQAFKNWASIEPDKPWHTWTHAGGWELTGLGTKRSLGFSEGFQLVPGGTMGEQIEQACGWCGMKLWKILDLDLADPTYAPLGLPAAGRITVAMCLRCVCYAPAFLSYDGTGGVAWHESNVRPEYNGNDDDEWDAPESGMSLGEPLPPGSWCDPWHAGGSVLGGRPDWIQDNDFQACPACGQTMTFFGAITGTDLYDDDLSEGCYYLMADPVCRVSTVVYQQS